MAVSVAILEIFSVKERPDLEIWIWGPSIRGFRHKKLVLILSVPHSVRDGRVKKAVVGMTALVYIFALTNSRHVVRRCGCVRPTTCLIHLVKLWPTVNQRRLGPVDHVVFLSHVVSDSGFIELSGCIC